MTLSLFFEQLATTPALWFVALLTLGVILVNGWTDAPNAIATCVATRAMKPRSAIIMAAIFNFLGVLVMTLLAPEVADTISNMVKFGSSDEALIGLCAAMSAIVIWAVLAWVFGIPTSESHALIAGLTGSAMAMQSLQGVAFKDWGATLLQGVDGTKWISVIIGLFVSIIVGFALGFVLTKLIQKICKNADYRKTNNFFGKGQIVAAAGTAFMHGAQDGQKFIGVFLLGINLSQGKAGVDFSNPIDVLWLIILCSLVMGLGTSIGGTKIIKSVGMDMVKLEKYQGFTADVTATLSLLLCSLFGMPVSTTHAKTTSIMGVGAARRVKSVNWSVVKEMVLTWVLTFPGCGLLGFLMTKLFLLIF